MMSKTFPKAWLIPVAMTAALSFNAQAMVDAADIIWIVDESGSMDTEHDFLNNGGAITPGVIEILTDALEAIPPNVGNGVDANQSGLVGFGSLNAHSPTNQVAHKHLVGGNDYGSGQATAVAADSLVASGGLEDGYQAIDFALDNYTLRGGNIAHQLILVSDEDRDINLATDNGNTSGSLLNFANIEAAIKAADAVLNVIVDVVLKDGTGATALGVTADGTALVADGSGGFTRETGGTVSGGFGTTIADYADLAHNLGGAVWDLNQIRAGGLTLDSFTAAFVDVKLAEIQNQVPTPATALLMAFGLMGLARARRTKATRLTA